MCVNSFTFLHVFSHVFLRVEQFYSSFYERKSQCKEKTAKVHLSSPEMITDDR